MRITRRTLQLGLAVLWLLDGALQCQRFMFTRAFARTALAPAGAGQPAFVAHSVHWASSIVLAHPVLTNSGFAAIQLAIGLGLCVRRSVRWALAGSVVWGVAVWWLGEGLGGLTTGETLLTGAPGAALLYAVIALIAWPSRDGGSSASPSRLAIPAWVALWIGGAGLQIAAGNNTGQSITMMFHDAGTDNPGWITRIDDHLAHLHITNRCRSADRGRDPRRALGTDPRTNPTDLRHHRRRHRSINLARRAGSRRPHQRTSYRPQHRPIDRAARPRRPRHPRRTPDKQTIDARPQRARTHSNADLTAHAPYAFDTPASIR